MKLQRSCGCVIYEKDVIRCATCGAACCASHSYSRVDGNNRAITRHAPSLCATCAKQQYPGDPVPEQTPTTNKDTRMDTLQKQVILAQQRVDELRLTIECKLARVNLNGLEGRAYRHAQREARYNLPETAELLHAESVLLNAENALIACGMTLSGVTLERECLLDPGYRQRIIEATLKVDH